MSGDERFPVKCPKCGQENWFNKRELCGQSGEVVRLKDEPSKDKHRRVRLNRVCDHCGYDLTRKTVRIDCEGYE